MPTTDKETKQKHIKGEKLQKKIVYRITRRLNIEMLRIRPFKYAYRMVVKIIYILNKLFSYK
jgi:hypothetical protein